MSGFKPGQISILEELKHHLQEAKVRTELERDTVIRLLKGIKSEGKVLGQFFFIERDLKYLVGQKRDDVSRPELTPLAGSMSFEEKMDHLIGLIESCIVGAEFDSQKSRLFDRSVYRIMYNGSYVNVTEVNRNKYGLVVYKADDEAFYYADYLIPKGFVDIPDVYKFSKEETNAFQQDKLDVEEIYKRLIHNGKILPII